MGIPGLRKDSTPDRLPREACGLAATGYSSRNRHHPDPSLPIVAQHCPLHASTLPIVAQLRSARLWL